MSFLSNLNWRNASKNFDAKKKVSPENMQKILDSIRLSPSSFGLQPYHVHVVTKKEVLTKIQENAWNQVQIGNCSHLLVFSTKTDIIETRIDEYMNLMSGGDRNIREKMSRYEDVIRSFLKGKSKDDIKRWADRQTYIALGFAMASCTELKIDSCPIEGFVPEKIDVILNFPEHLKSVVLLPMGYRTEEPSHPKVRFPKEDLFTL